MKTVPTVLSREKFNDFLTLRFSKPDYDFKDELTAEQTDVLFEFVELMIDMLEAGEFDLPAGDDPPPAATDCTCVICGEPFGDDDPVVETGAWSPDQPRRCWHVACAEGAVRVAKQNEYLYYNKKWGEAGRLYEELVICLREHYDQRRRERTARVRRTFERRELGLH